MRIFECQKDVLRSVGMPRAVISTIVNFEKLPAGRKTVLRAEGMLRGPQHPRYWPTDLDFRLLKYAEPARGLPHTCICDAESRSLDFENLPPLFTGSSFFSGESTCRRSPLVQAHRENAQWSSSEMTGRRDGTGFLLVQCHENGVIYSPTWHVLDETSGDSVWRISLCLLNFFNGTHRCLADIKKFS